MATSSIANTVSLIQTVVGGVVGIKAAPTTYPTSINRPELPLVLTVPERGTTQQLTFKQNFRETERVYSIRCYVDAIGQNIMHNRISDSMNLLQLVLEELETNRILQDGITIIGELQDSGIISGESVLTSGLVKMVLAGTPYTGFYVDAIVREVYKL